jgi:hypothetical protein
VKGGQHQEDGANTTSAADIPGKDAGHEAHIGIMILALAMRHSVGRPAHGNGGRYETLWSGLPAAVRTAFVLYRGQESTAPPNGAKFVVNASHRETHFFHWKYVSR